VSGPARLEAREFFGEVKNRGDRVLSEIEITIYYLDKNGLAIFEKQYYPVLVSKFSIGDSKQDPRVIESQNRTRSLRGLCRDSLLRWAGQYV